MSKESERERGGRRRQTPEHKEYQRRYQLARHHKTKHLIDKEALGKYQSDYREKNRETLNEAQRRRGRLNYQKNPQPYAARGRRARLAKYSMTENDFQDMLDWQGRCCAICQREATTTKMCVDHDHETGEVRGILCSQCNRALGLFRESAALLSEAADYLTKSSSGATLTTNREESNLPYYLRGFHVRPSTAANQSRNVKPS